MDKEKIIIIGAGGHAKVVYDCINKDRYNIVGFVDKDITCIGKKILDNVIIGDDTVPGNWIRQGIKCCIMGIGHVGNYKIRNQLFELYQRDGFDFINAIHHSSTISNYVKIGIGNVIMPQAIINAGVVIGNNNIINSGATIEHDGIIGDGVHIAPGCSISGGVSVGDNTFIGVGSVVSNDVYIGSNSIIGAGAVVVNDIPDHVLAVGCPAKVIKEVV